MCTFIVPVIYRTSPNSGIRFRKVIIPRWSWLLWRSIPRRRQDRELKGLEFSRFYLNCSFLVLPQNNENVVFNMKPKRCEPYQYTASVCAWPSAACSFRWKSVDVCPIFTEIVVSMPRNNLDFIALFSRFLLSRKRVYIFIQMTTTSPPFSHKH